METVGAIQCELVSGENPLARPLLNREERILGNRLPVQKSFPFQEACTPS